MSWPEFGKSNVEAHEISLPAHYDDRTKLKTFGNGRVLVTHPDWPPMWLHDDGSLTPLEAIGAELQK